MRAIYYPGEFINGQKVLLEGDKAHHLNNVVRVKKNDQILILSGKGERSLARIENIQKRKLEIEIISQPEKQDGIYNIELACAKVKKDAMDLILKQACELGVKKISVIESEYAQRYELKEARVQRLLESAIEQSNFAYIPSVQEIKLSDINKSAYDIIVYLSSQTEGQAFGDFEIKKTDRVLVLIGPEAGLSEEEEKLIEQMSNSYRLHLPVPIMRAPTAVSCGVGAVLAKFLMH